MKTFLCGVVVVSVVVSMATAQRQAMTLEGSFTWEAAVKACEDANGEIAMEITKQENDAMYEMISKTGIVRWWIGMRENEPASVPRTFEWHNKKALTTDKAQLFWHKDEPNNFKGRPERCIEMRYLPEYFKPTSKEENWNDRPCDEPTGVLCFLKEGFTAMPPKTTVNPSSPSF